MQLLRFVVEIAHLLAPVADREINDIVINPNPEMEKALAAAVEVAAAILLTAVGNHVAIWIGADPVEQAADMNTSGNAMLAQDVPANERAKRADPGAGHRVRRDQTD